MTLIMSMGPFDVAARPTVVSRDPVATSLHEARHCFELGQWEQALRLFDALVVQGNASAEVHNYRARALAQLNRHPEALNCIDQALAIDPSNRHDLRNRAVILMKLGRTVEAVEIYEGLRRLHPDDPDVLVRLALALNQVDRRDEALTHASRAVALRPDDPDVINARVIVLDNLGRYTEAFADLDRMLALNRGSLDAVNNAGMVLARTGRFGEALVCYNRSLAQNPDQPQALYNRSLVRLALGDWIRGFKEFESRWNTPPLNATRPTGLGPLWLGDDSDLTGRVVLAYHEQGYGDTLQCVRYLPLLAERGAKIILAVPAELLRLMQSLDGVWKCVASLQVVPPHDLQLPLMSLPWAFRTTPDTVPGHGPYLHAPPDLIERWSKRLGVRERPRIGLCWGGRRYAPINYPRDIPLAALRSLLSCDADFISLQKDYAPADLEALNRFPNLRRLEAEVQDFADSAAIIETLDLVITVDTAVAHLAGALGKTVWLMNRHAACWRWLQTGAGSCWYPSMTQFRQATPGDWTGVITQVGAALKAFLHEQAAGRAALPRHTRPALPRAPAPTPKIRFVSATRLSQQDFFRSTPLGRSLPLYQTFPRRQAIELRLFPENREGLPGLYNQAIEEARADPAVLIFIHDDVYLSDFYWSVHLHKAMEHFDIVGLAGNRRRAPRQASWMYLDDDFTRDSPENLSGVLGHGKPFPDLTQLSVYGEPGQEVKLLDGVMLAGRSDLLLEKNLRFDTRFSFHFYDLDFCRQAELKGVRMGTWALSVVHESAGRLGVADWRQAYRIYLDKYQEAL